MKKRKKPDFFDKLNKEDYATTTPRCEHFGSCGGCRFQDMSYEDQVSIKCSFLNSVFNAKVPVTPAPDAFGYRNRMDFVYAFDKFGLRQKGDFRTVVDISTCHLIPAPVQEVFTKVKQALFKQEIPSYDFLEKQGFLRYVVFRFAPNTKELMVLFTTTPLIDNPALQKSFEIVLQEVAELVASVQWFENETITDLSVPPVAPRLVLGKPQITEQIGDLSLSFSPHSFFQNNSAMTRIVFDKIKDAVHGNVVDLCCGVGAISLYVANKATSIIGIEEVASAIELARHNAKQNNILNAKFFAAPMKKFLDYAPMDVDTIIVDPPRAGLGNKVVQKILAAQPDKIIYMSCNPKTQKSDMDILLQTGEYELQRLEGFDFFPQTPHIETLAVLQRK